jgi:NAD(P)-dependent dehydrogenase (short-subunit alcohol dehydrogenase family)
MGQKVLVTGSAGDIGTAIVHRLHDEGYSVVGLDKDSPEDESRYAGFYQVDLRSDEEIYRASEDILRVHSPLWSLVYCAGVYPIKPFDDYDLGTWDEVNAVNIRGAFQVLKFLRGAITPGGRVVLIASGAAHVGSRDIGYSASKAAMLGLVRGLTKVLAPHGILINAICPGVISSRMSKRMSPEHIGEYTKAIPLGRVGAPAEVAVGVSFLLDAENTYMTGATIDINGGLYSR